MKTTKMKTAKITPGQNGHKKPEKKPKLDLKNSVIVDYDFVEGNLDLYYIPPGYDIIEVYHGGGELIRKNGENTYIENHDRFIDAARELAETYSHMNKKAMGRMIKGWKKEYPEFLQILDPDKTVVLAANTKWGKQTAEIYCPSGIKQEIWTDIQFGGGAGKIKVAAAKFLLDRVKKPTSKHNDNRNA